MDNLTKQRYISSSIWSDDWFDGLSTKEKLFYFYLLTNQHTTPAGVYPCTLRDMRADFGIPREEIVEMLEKFAEAGKAFHYEDYIIIPKWMKHQKLGARNGLFLGAVKTLKALPDAVKAFISDRSHYDFDVRKYLDIPGEKVPEDARSSLSKRIGGATPQNCAENHENGSVLGGATPQNHAKNGHDSDCDVDSDSDSDLDLDSDIVVVVDSISISSRGEEKPVENSENNPTTTSPLDIQEKAKEAGYFLTERQASGFLALDHSWLSGRHNFLVFASKKIDADPFYSKKQQNERERIFAKGWKYQNWIQEYPGWLENQVKTDKLRALERLKDAPPRECPRCGSELAGKKCPKCGGSVAFDEEKQKWEYQERFDFGFADSLGRKNPSRETSPPEPENREDDIEF
jgi:hypothetical protein